jgi:hypothetical protein
MTESLSPGTIVRGEEMGLGCESVSIVFIARKGGEENRRVGHQIEIHCSNHSVGVWHFFVISVAYDDEFKQ